MNTTTCMRCQSSDLYNAEMTYNVGLTKGKSLWSSWTFIPVQCTVCLSCGFIAPYVAPAELEKVRAWKAKDCGK